MFKSIHFAVAADTFATAAPKVVVPPLGNATDTVDASKPAANNGFPAASLITKFLPSILSAVTAFA